MNIVPELNNMGDKSIYEIFGNTELGGQIADYFKGIKSTGSIALGSFIQNERSGLICKPFSSNLLESKCIEVNFEKNVLVSSDYPVARFGDFHNNILVVVAVSPRKAIIYSSSDDISAYCELPVEVLGELINLCTSMKANCGYFTDETKRYFFEEHLGWSKSLRSLEDQKKYVKNFILNEGMKYA